MEFPDIGSVASAVCDPGGSDPGTDTAPTQNVRDGNDVMVVPSLCMACEEQGITRLLLTRIPFFRDVIIMAFSCEHCGLKNSEVQSAQIQDKGVRFTVTVAAPRDLNRQLVKGDRASVTIPELDFEIPSTTQAGTFTTIEGLLSGALEKLEATQPARRAIDASSADAVAAFCTRLSAARSGEASALPFTLVLDDPSGNSSVENPLAPRPDARMRVRRYARSREQDEALGLNAEESAGLESIPEEGGGGGGEEEVDTATLGAGSSAATQHNNVAVDHAGLLRAYRTKAEAFARDRAALVDRRGGSRDLSGNVPSGFKKGGAQITASTERARATILARGGIEGGEGGASAAASSTRAGVVRDAFGSISGLMFDSSTSEDAKAAMRFPVPCHMCSTVGDCLMCVTDVPHFKEVILMGFSCDACGWRNVEVKGGGALPDLGTRTVLRYEPGREWSEADMGRDVIKGDTSSVEIPELELSLEQGSLGGMYTTVEGLLTAVRDKLMEVDPLGYAGAGGAGGGGDSEDAGRRSAMASFLIQLESCIAGARSFTLILTDPMANSWIYSPYAGGASALSPREEGEGEGGGTVRLAGARGGVKKTSAACEEGEPVLLEGIDPRLFHESYVRSHDEDLELGILDMDAPRGEDDEGEEEEMGAST